MDSNAILFSLVALIVGAVITYFFQRLGDKNKVTEEELSRLIKDMEQLKVTSVNEVRAREIIKDAIEPTSSTVKEIKDKMERLGDVLQDTQMQLATEMAYKRGTQQKEAS